MTDHDDGAHAARMIREVRGKPAAGDERYERIMQAIELLAACFDDLAANGANRYDEVVRRLSAIEAHQRPETHPDWPLWREASASAHRRLRAELQRDHEPIKWIERMRSGHTKTCADLPEGSPCICDR